MATTPTEHLRIAENLLNMENAPVTATDYALTGLLALTLEIHHKDTERTSYVESLEQKLAKVEEIYGHMVDLHVEGFGEDGLRQVVTDLRIALFGLSVEDF